MGKKRVGKGLANPCLRHQQHAWNKWDFSPQRVLYIGEGGKYGKQNHSTSPHQFHEEEGFLGHFSSNEHPRSEANPWKKGMLSKGGQAELLEAVCRAGCGSRAAISETEYGALSVGEQMHGQLLFEDRANKQTRAFDLS